MTLDRIFRPLARLGLKRPVLSQTVLTLLCAAYIILLLNQGFWATLQSQFPGGDPRALIFGAGIFVLTVLLIELLGPAILQKPVAIVMILIAASAGYYQRNFGVMIDRDMIRNIFETTATESSHLITLRMVGSLVLTGLLPAALVVWVKVRRVAPLHQLWRWPLGVGLSFALLVGALFSHYKDYSAMLRERHEVMGAYQPGASLVAAWRFGREQWAVAQPVAAPWGTDATSGPMLAAAKKPVLLVLYVGETARAQNFTLTGYNRDTTPELSKRTDLAVFEAGACGTSTAVSVPCMFSGLGQADYSRAAALGRENLLDVLHHAGWQVIWSDNNTGDQTVATRTGSTRADASLAPDACKGECTDEVFLPLIQKTAAEMTQNTVLVLHMIGSHGPAYHLRYPAARAAFQPDCRSAQFSDCTSDQILNAYDNSIRETDYVLSRSIDLLSAADRVLPAMIYLSDHGESLGENGLYLHAAPAFMAPPVQTRVPFLIWSDPRFDATMGRGARCAAPSAGESVSHDNLVPTVLGLLDISTKLRTPALDLTQACHGGDLM